MLDRFIIGTFRIAFATWWWWLAKIFGDNKLRLLSANWAFCTSFACSWYRNDGSSPFPSLRLVAVLCWLLWLWPRFCCFAVAWFLLTCVGRYSTHIWPGDVHFNLTLGFCVSFFLPPSCAFGMLFLFCLFFAFVLLFFSVFLLRHCDCLTGLCSRSLCPSRLGSLDAAVKAVVTRSNCCN